MSRRRTWRLLTDSPDAFLDLFGRSVRGEDAVDFWTELEGPAPQRYPADTMSLGVETEAALHNYISQNWRMIRDGGCLASKADGSRCGRDSAMTPFCWQHEGAAFEWYDRERVESGLHLTLPSGVTRFEAATLIGQAKSIIAAHGEGEVVYFYELVGQCLVKIGTTRRLANRLASFRIGKGCTFPDGADHTTGRLIGTTPGGRDLEQHLHRVHHQHRVVGEWFRLVEDVADHIASLVGTPELEESA